MHFMTNEYLTCLTSEYEHNSCSQLAEQPLTLKDICRGRLRSLLVEETYVLLTYSLTDLADCDRSRQRRTRTWSGYRRLYKAMVRLCKTDHPRLSTFTSTQLRPIPLGKTELLSLCRTAKECRRHHRPTRHRESCRNRTGSRPCEEDPESKIEAPSD